MWPRRILDRLRGRRGVYVRLVYTSGEVAQLGPMSRYAAELVLAGIGIDAAHGVRRVASARILVP